RSARLLTLSSAAVMGMTGATEPAAVLERVADEAVRVTSCGAALVRAHAVTPRAPAAISKRIWFDTTRDIMRAISRLEDSGTGFIKATILHRLSQTLAAQRRPRPKPLYRGGHTSCTPACRNGRCDRLVPRKRANPAVDRAGRGRRHRHSAGAFLRHRGSVEDEWSRLHGSNHSARSRRQD